MSRIGKQPVQLSTGITIDQQDANLTVKGPKGEITVELLDKVDWKQEGDQVTFSVKEDSKEARAQHGLIRSLVNNAVIGVEKGFEKVLEVNGVGYKVNLSGKKLTMNLGHSHPVEFTAPEDIELVVDGNKITVKGVNKQQVGQVAAEIREFRKPEPYKGKGIKYDDEQIVRKAGKAAAGGE